jgi:hypothetical protein
LIGRWLHRGGRGEPILPFATAALGIIWCALVPSPFPSGHWNFGVMSDPAREIFAFIREQTPAGAVVATSKYRSFHLFTQRTTIRLPSALLTPKEIMQWLRDYRITDVVVKYSPPKWKNDHTDCPDFPLCRGDASDLGVREVFRNSDFALFHVSSAKD